MLTATLLLLVLFLIIITDDWKILPINDANYFSISRNLRINDGFISENPLTKLEFNPTPQLNPNSQFHTPPKISSMGKFSQILFI